MVLPSSLGLVLRTFADLNTWYHYKSRSSIIWKHWLILLLWQWWDEQRKKNDVIYLTCIFSWEFQKTNKNESANKYTLLDSNI